ncbi:MAG TPA: periplasmic heavy metal sensor [Thermoanaerobaculia bacterium]|jgi:Spy/CpxP family protein refolding chaperone|nr:periplasmic heavy metal sensor [Thermoanaerobaculia bacterium]
MRSAIRILGLALGFTALVALAPSPAAAQDDPLGKQFFPPELVLQHQQEIALTDAQREAIKAAINAAQPQFVDLQMKMQGEVGKLLQLVSAPAVDEKAAITQAEKVMALETQIKKTQLTFLIRVKNTLSAEQQAKLTAKRS